jgi:two-component system phosphate regulon sensor histidine kinase PhoR
MARSPFSIGFSRTFILSSLFLFFIITIVTTIFSTFIYNNSRVQLIQSLYLQAQSINQSLPQLSSTNVDFDLLADQYAVTDDNGNELRVSIINSDWSVIGDSAVIKSNLSSLDKHSPETRQEISDALLNDYGSTTRKSDTTGRDFIYVALLRDKDDLSQGIIRVALPLDINASFYNFFVYPFFIILVLVIASSTFLSLSVENNLRRELSKLYEITQRALKGKKFKKIGPADSQVQNISKTVEEISERLAKEIDNTISQRANFNSVLDSVTQGIIIFNKKLKVTFVNDVALEIFGKHQIFLKERIKSKKLAHINKLLKELSVVNQIESEFSIDVGKNKRYFLLSASTINTSDDLVLVINDITSLKTIEERRKNLISDISHEIKTPVSVIRAGAETLQNGAINDINASEKFLSAITANSERLAEMVNDLLELERIEQGQLYQQKENINPRNEINLIIESLETLAHEQNVELINQINDDFYIHTDKSAFRGIFLNLLNNAIKYSKEGGLVTISTYKTKTNTVITIEDNGYGIEKNNLQRIFDRFYRTPKARAHTNGSGLGLSLVKQQINQIGGMIDVKSKINKGTTFFVSFPIKS